MPKSDIWSLEPGKPFPQYTDAELAALPDYVAEQLSAPLRDRRAAALRLEAAITSQPGVEVRPAPRCFGYAPIEPVFIDEDDWNPAIMAAREVEGERRFAELMATPDGAPIKLYPPLSEFMPPREFRTRPGRLKPGSLDENGGLVGNDGGYYMRGPVEVRIDNLKTARLLALEAAGWEIIDQTYGRDDDGLVAEFARFSAFIG